VFGARHDDVADRIFYVVILVPVEGVLPRQRKLHLGVAARRQWMRPQIVAAEQRIAPVCAARPAHMEMCGSHVGGWTIVQLAPAVALGRRRRNVVMVNICGAATADTSEGGVEYSYVQRGDRYLHVNDIFGREPWHGGRADMVNAQRGLAKRPGQ